MRAASTSILAACLALASAAAGAAAQPWSELSLPDDDAHDNFGTAVAADRSFVVVGAPGESDADLFVGSAHLFRNGRRGWSKVQELRPARTGGYPAFGASVALHGRLLAVGAPGRYATGSSAGFVEIHERHGHRWHRAAVLTADEPQQGAHFGAALALHRDTLAVGAPGSSVAPGTVGAVHLFRRRGGTWTEVAKVVGRPWDHLGRFGASVALDGERLVVGAPGESHLRDGDDSGTVYVFDRDGDGLAPPIEIRGGDRRSQVFGSSVALDRHRIAVGAPAVGPGILGESAAYVFAAELGAWHLEARLRPSAVRPADRYAQRVALRGGQLYVGAPLTPVRGDRPHVLLGTGVVHAFSFRRGGWRQAAVLRPTGGATFFGSAIDAERGLLVVGAPTPDPARAAAYARVGPVAAPPSGR